MIRFLGDDHLRYWIGQVILGWLVVGGVVSVFWLLAEYNH